MNILTKPRLLSERRRGSLQYKRTGVAEIAKMARVAIVGGGVSGLSVGLYLSETHVTRELNLTVFSDQFSPSTTSDRAGAIIRAMEGPSYYGGATNEDDTRRWTTTTFERLHELHESGTGAVCGLTKLPMVMGHEGSPALPWFTAVHPKLRVLAAEESAEYGLPSRLKTVWKFDCYCFDTTQYLCWLRSSFTERGGLVVQRKIGSPSELTRDYDVVVNCTGLGARELVGDYSVYPVRGQLLEVAAPRVNTIYYNREPCKGHTTYVIPQNGRVFLGGSAGPNNWSTTVNPEQTESIYQRCVELCPQLRGCRVVRTWAGLRPARPTVRVEVDGEFGGESLLLHNYGHGGHGFTLSWGCAADIAEMIETHLQLKPKSKL